MRYRKLGDTGLKVSEISFGTIPVLKGDVPVLPEYFNLDDDEALKVMEYAYQKGCNFFDTAIVPEYGDAEIKLGKFAKLVGRENIIISDKARFFDGNRMYNAVHESCKNLDSYADIYFVHQVDEKTEKMAFEKNGAIDALLELKKEGLIKYTGVASHYYDILLRAAKDDRVDVLQGSGNILERGMLDRIENEKIFRNKGFILNKIYAAGILPAFFPVSELISGALSYPVSTALIGFGNFVQIDEAMEKDPSNYDRPEFSNVISTLEKSFVPIPCDRCQRCSCINGIEIHILLRQYNYYFLGKNYWALRKLDMSIGKSAEKCRRCVEMPCLKKCPRKINIPEKIQMIKKLVDIHIRNSVI